MDLVNGFRISLVFFLICLLFCCGCIDNEENGEMTQFQIKITEISSRCGYHDVIYKDSVVEVTVDVFNPTVNKGVKTIHFSIDDVIKDSKTVTLNASEEKTVRFTTLQETYEEFPLENIHLDTVGIHQVTVGNKSKNFTVYPPVLEVRLDVVEWRESVQGYIPFIRLRVENPSDSFFFLGGSFGVLTAEGIYEGRVDEWDLIKGVVNQTGYYKLPSSGIVDVTVACYSLISSFPDGSDVSLEKMMIYAGFPWLDFTGGIIGELDL